MEVYLISALGTLNLFLAGLVVKFVFDRRKENVARWEKLELRLQSGVEAMQAVIRKVDRLEDKIDRVDTKASTAQEAVAKVADDVVRVSYFDRYCESHEEVHKNLDKSIGRLADGQTQIAADLKGMCGQMQGVREAMSSLSSKLVVGKEVQR